MPARAPATTTCSTGGTRRRSSQWDGFRHIRNHAALHDEPGTGTSAVSPTRTTACTTGRRAGSSVAPCSPTSAGGARRRGRPLQYDRSDPIEPDELDECLAAAGDRAARRATCSCMRTGWVGWYERLARRRARRASPNRPRSPRPGLRSGEHLAEVLWDLHIAAIGCDNPAVEVWPPGALSHADTEAAVRADRRRLHEIFTHTAAAADARPAARARCGTWRRSPPTVRPTVATSACSRRRR